MFGSKPTLKEGSTIFSIKKNGEFNDFIFAVVTGVDDKKVGVTGVIVNLIGLKNKIAQGKTGERSNEILNHPTPDNVVLALVYRVESENFAEVLDLDVDKCDIIPPKIYAMLDGWIRESIPEFINLNENSLSSLPQPSKSLLKPLIAIQSFLKKARLQVLIPFK